METPLSPLEFARRTRRLYGAREAVVDGDLRLTYEEFFDRCDRWSAALATLGVRQGDRVATIAPNTHAQLESFYAVPQLGAVLVPMNYRLTANDFVYMVNHSGSTVLCVHSDYLDAIDGVEVVRIWADSVDPVGVVTFSVTDHDPGLVAAYLSAEHGIGVRDGRFCAHPLLARLGVPAGAIRASVGVGTEGEAVERLLGAVRAYLDEGPRARYAVADGCWQVDDDARPLIEVNGLAALASTAAAACGPALD